MARDVLPPNARRIAEEQGGTLLEEYESRGLTCYRQEWELPNGNMMVEEGWITERELPNGNIVYTQRKHRDITREQAENEE